MKKDVLYINPKIEMRRSPIHRWGVFAREFISSGEVLEEVPFISIPMSNTEGSSLFIDYRFNYPSGVSPWEKQVIPFGMACIYNHSDTPNAKWFTDQENELFVFQTIKNIDPDTEICTYYGGQSYWNDGRTHTQVK